MGNDSSSKIILIDAIEVTILDDVVRTLSNVKHVDKLRRRLFFLGALETLGYDFFFFFSNNDIININKGALIAMKGKMLKYILIGKTVLGGE